MARASLLIAPLRASWDTWRVDERQPFLGLAGRETPRRTIAYILFNAFSHGEISVRPHQGRRLDSGPLRRDNFPAKSGSKADLVAALTQGSNPWVSRLWASVFMLIC